MLVISRKAGVHGETGSTFTIGDSVVQVIDIRGGKVRLGIVAAADVPIVRDDVVNTQRQSRLQGCTNGSPKP